MKFTTTVAEAMVLRFLCYWAVGTRELLKGRRSAREKIEAQGAAWAQSAGLALGPNGGYRTLAGEAAAWESKAVLNLSRDELTALAALASTFQPFDRVAAIFQQMMVVPQLEEAWIALEEDLPALVAKCEMLEKMKGLSAEERAALRDELGRAGEGEKEMDLEAEK